jgi:tetratricopeptide (TPR) repeat protein
MRKSMKKIGIGAALLLFACHANSFDFIPNDYEFNLWNMDCKATYANMSTGQKTKFANMVPKALLTRERYLRSKDALGGIWHYCASIIWLYRAEIETNAKKKQFNLERARANANFSWTKCPKHEPIRADVGVYLARSHYALGDKHEAHDVLNEAIRLYPQQPSPYLAKAIILKGEGKTKEALKLLEGGNDRLEGRSSEIHYHLGLLYLEVGDLDLAIKHSDEAYKRGYPLMGLKKKIGKILDKKK